MVAGVHDEYRSSAPVPFSFSRAALVLRIDGYWGKGTGPGLLKSLGRGSAAHGRAATWRTDSYESTHEWDTGDRAPMDYSAGARTTVKEQGIHKGTLDTA
eukprot:7375937-Prymnesium_polylepis.1